MEETKKIINYEMLEVPVKDIEKILSKYDNEEQALILKIINQRFRNRLTKLKTQDLVGSMNVGDMIKGFLKGREKE